MERMIYMKPLVIIAHPNMNESRFNARLKAELAKYPDLADVHELYASYPDFHIDVEKEQKLLEDHDIIVYQYPLYWYNFTPLLKKYFDDVLTYGWAYGSKGTALHGKKMALATTAGGSAADYTPEGSEKCTLDDLFAPFRATANLIGTTVLPYFAIYGATPDMDDATLDTKAAAYVDYLRNLK